MRWHVIEYIGAHGVKHTACFEGHGRLLRPLPADLVDVAAVRDIYPFSNRYATVYEVETGFVGPGEVHLCLGNASVFLGWNEERGEPTADISGGPFHCLALSDFEWQGTFRDVTVWNWGNNLPGGGNGVYFHVLRPLFTLTARAVERIRAESKPAVAS